MFTVGLTGGIGSGKSAVSDQLASFGISVVDADVVAREVVAPGSDGLKAVVTQFGQSILAADGSLHRKALRELVFADLAQRRLLENILHPLIHAQIQGQLALARGPYALLVSPLLLETSQKQLVDRILVVDCPPQMQIERTSNRDDCSPEQVRAIMAAQMERSVRLQAADDVLHNEQGMEELLAEAGRLHELYLQMAETKS